MDSSGNGDSDTYPNGLAATATGGRARLTRAQSRALTRERLLEAAARLVAGQGLAETSVEDIAETAGYSIGAVYSNFQGKEELLLALLDEHVGASAAQLSERFEAALADPAARRRAIGDHFDHLVADHRSCWLLSSELWRHALRHPEMRPALVRTQEVCRASIGRIVARVFEQEGLTPPAPPEELARMVEALADGLVRQRHLEPAGGSGETFRRAVEWLLAGALREAAAAPDAAGGSTS